MCIHLWVIFPLYNTSSQFGDFPAMFDDTEGNPSATRTECTLRLRYHENFGVPGAQKRGESPIVFFGDLMDVSWDFVDFYWDVD